MRDFRDAKVMAHSLREALKAKAVVITHSESLELIARTFGYDNWNILSARIGAPQPSADAMAGPQDPASQPVLYCSFCGKSQHEVKKLIAGPTVFICDECVDLCVDIIDEELLRLIEGDEQGARAMSTDKLLHYVEHARKAEQRNRLVLQHVDRMLELRRNALAVDDDALASSNLMHLKNKTTEELVSMQNFSQAQLKRYEQAVKTAMSMLNERAH
jgi:hypothetical protein